MLEPVTRRKFLASASIGVAAVSVAAATGLATIAGSPALAVSPTRARTAAHDPEPDLTPLGDDVIAHVTDASKGEVVLYFGTREVVYHDRALVSRLLAEARRPTQEA